MKNISTWVMTAIAVSCLGMAAAQAEGEPGTALNAGFGLTDGNSDTLVANVGIDHIVGEEVAVDQFSAGAEWNYGETEEVTTVENASGYLRHQHMLNDPMYGYLLGTIFHDDIADLAYRLTLGPGVGTVLWSDDASELGAEIGAAWVREESKATVADLGKVDITEDSAALRVAEYFNHQLSETANIWQTLEYLPDFDDFGNYLLTAEIGVEAALNGSLSLRVVAIDRYDSEATARGQKDNDISVLAGLSYKL